MDQHFKRIHRYIHSVLLSSELGPNVDYFHPILPSYLLFTFDRCRLNRLSAFGFFSCFLIGSQLGDKTVCLLVFLDLLGDKHFTSRQTVLSP